MTPIRPLREAEFIALIAILFANIAFSIDAMLPALPAIAAELTPADPNKAQLIITSFVLGMGLGTLVAGPLSDSYGRRTIILCGAAIYCVGAALAYAAPTLETMLAARVIQGLGVAGPRIVSLAMVRDLYAGRAMARIISFAMTIFTLVPAVAPLLGTGIIAVAGWRGIFVAFMLFSAVSMLWLMLRQPETLPPAARRPFRVAPLVEAFREVLSHRVIVTAIAVQMLCFGALFGTLSSTQQIFGQTFGMADSFPFWFAGIALVSGGAGLINARLVGRVGMRRMVTVTLLAQVVSSAAMAGLALAGLPFVAAFAVYLVWTTGVFFGTGLTLGNLNALALEPVGHIAGMASSVVGAISTVSAVAIAAPLGLAFDGTPVPLAIGVAVLSALGYALMRTLPGR